MHGPKNLARRNDWLPLARIVWSQFHGAGMWGSIKQTRKYFTSSEDPSRSFHVQNWGFYGPADLTSKVLLSLHGRGASGQATTLAMLWPMLCILQSEVRGEVYAEDRMLEKGEWKRWLKHRRMRMSGLEW